MEETGTDLESYGKDEKDQAEILHEAHDGGVDPDSEMAQYYGYEKDPCGTDRNPFDLETSEP
jgi:hypothetical protein